MPVQITIIGLGQIGASMGLALASHKDKILRIGHDKKAEVEREALKKGWRIKWNTTSRVQCGMRIWWCCAFLSVRSGRLWNSLRLT